MLTLLCPLSVQGPLRTPPPRARGRVGHTCAPTSIDTWICINRKHTHHTHKHTHTAHAPFERHASGADLASLLGQRVALGVLAQLVLILLGSLRARLEARVVGVVHDLSCARVRTRGDPPAVQMPHARMQARGRVWHRGAESRGTGGAAPAWRAAGRPCPSRRRCRCGASARCGCPPS